MKKRKKKKQIRAQLLLKRSDWSTLNVIDGICVQSPPISKHLLICSSRVYM